MNMLIIIKNCEKLNYNELKSDLKKTSNHREYQILKLKIYEYKLINDAIKQNYIDYIKIEN
jgi:dTDP-D-glucose 4,6-dehydratase